MRHHPFLDRIAAAGVRLGLARIRSFLDALGSPQAGLPAVHVAGTNGKGSVAAMVGAVHAAAGRRVGVYLSPHLQQINERIAVGGRRIDDATLSGLLGEVEQEAMRQVRRGLLDPGEDGLPLTWYEAMTACALLHFARERVDLAVLEVGLGGRLDATNAVDGMACAVVTVELDHTRELGSDLASIAAEKAGVMRPRAPVVAGRLGPGATRVLRAMAGEARAPLLLAGVDYDVAGRPGSFDFSFGDGRMEGLSVSLAGAHQVHNAGVAIALVRALGERRPELAAGEDAIRRGLASTVHPGRCERLAPDLLVDGAHNPSGAERLRDWLHELPRNEARTLLLGASSDKDVRSLAAVLAPEVDRVLTTACSHPRAMPPGEVARALVGLSVPVMPAGMVEEALGLARRGGGCVVVAGSLFLVGAVRDLVGAR